jgi:citrate synthase
MERAKIWGTEFLQWEAGLKSNHKPARLGIWPENDNPSGFDPYGTSTAKPVLQILEKLLPLLPGSQFSWFVAHRRRLEASCGRPLNMFGVVALAFNALGFSPTQGEMLVLLLRLPGAAVHALEQRERGFRQFPFFNIELDHDPKANPISEVL